MKLFTTPSAVHRRTLAVRAVTGPSLTLRAMDEYEQIESWRRIIESQHDVVSRSQALEHGFTDARVTANVSGGRWLRAGRGVIATVTGPPTVAARQHATLLSVGMPAALSHGTAGRFWGLIPGEWPPDEPPHATVPYGRSAVRRADLVVHRSRAFAHITVDVDGLVVIAKPHTVIDLAVAEPDARAAMRAVIHYALVGRVRPEALTVAVEARRPRRYRRPCETAIELLRDGVRSELEARYALDVEAAHGLPRAERQVGFALDGSTIYEDCLYRCPGGDVIVRLDGFAYHLDRATRLRDRRRGNAAERAGRARMEFGWEEVTETPCRSAREVVEVLVANGWPDASENCTACL